MKKVAIKPWSYGESEMEGPLKSEVQGQPRTNKDTISPEF